MKRALCGALPNAATSYGVRKERHIGRRAQRVDSRAPDGRQSLRCPAIAVCCVLAAPRDRPWTRIASRCQAQQRLPGPSTAAHLQPAAALKTEPSRRARLSRQCARLGRTALDRLVFSHAPENCERCRVRTHRLDCDGLPRRNGSTSVRQLRRRHRVVPLRL